jgi:hypothetical protein
MSFNIKLIQRAAQGDQNNLGNSYSNNLPAITEFATLSVTM